MAYESPLTIADVIKDISSNKYVLPAIQREFVWDTVQIERLFDSVMRDYPIGAFLFWELQDEQNIEYEFYSFLQNYHEKNSRHNPKINLSGSNNVMAVLDGQQRLTSLYIGLKGSYAYKLRYQRANNSEAYPKRKLYLNIVQPSANEQDMYDFKFLTGEDAINDELHCWFEVGQILSMTKSSEVNKYFLENVVHSSTGVKYSAEQENFANECLFQLFTVINSNPSISYYRVKSNELDKVLNIFIRVNSGGTILSYSDLLLSIATAQWESYDAREEITEFVDEINNIGNGFNVNKDFVLKSALVLTDFRDIAFKVDNFNKTNMLKMEENWDAIKKSILLAFKLVSAFGYSRDSLNSNNAVIPIAYYLKTIGLPENFEVSTSQLQNREKIKKWLIMSLVKKAFSGQPDNVLRPLRDIIQRNGKEDFPIDQIIERLRGTSKSIVISYDDIETMLDSKYGRGDTHSILMLLYPSLDFNNKFHIDHIYPKSKFNKKVLNSKNVIDENALEYINHVNDLSNLQMLAAIPNIEKQDMDFDVWFNKTYPSETDKIHYRQINYMPEMEYSYENFLKFVNKRRVMLKEALIDLLGVSRLEEANSDFNGEIGVEAPGIRDEMEEIYRDSNPVKKSFWDKLPTLPENVQMLFKNLCEKMESLVGVKSIENKHYVTFKHDGIFMCATADKKRVIANVNIDPKMIEIEEGFSRDITGIGSFGVGNLQLFIYDEKGLNKAVPYIMKAYNSK